MSLEEGDSTSPTPDVQATDSQNHSFEVNMETPTAAEHPAASCPRRTFRQRIDGLMDHIMMKMDGDSTERHMNARYKAGNLLGAATKIVEALEATVGAETVGGEEARFVVEAGPWDRTETLQQLATEHGVVCQITCDGARTTVDLTGASRATVLVYLNGLINKAVKELLDADHYESALSLFTWWLRETAATSFLQRTQCALAQSTF
jgi:hypothetical protein